MTEIILGPPGTGKTTTLLNLVDEVMASGVAPNQIGYVSFTKRAAKEAVDRACAKFHFTKDELPYFRTLHSMCFHMLHLDNSDVMDDSELQAFAREVGMRITGRISEDGTLAGYEDGDKCLFIDNMARIRYNGNLREAYDKHVHEVSINWSQVSYFERCLTEFKKANSLLDFTDMLTEFARRGSRPKLKALFIDEAQDLSTLQWQVVKILAEGAERVVVAGDDDQAIYTWAGADVQHLINLQGDVRVLGQSYRVPRAVQGMAEKLIRRVGCRRPKTWAPRNAEGVVDRVTNWDALDLDDQDILILSRNNYVLNNVRKRLQDDGYLFEWRGYPSVKASVVNAIFAWETLRKGNTVPAGVVREIYSFMSMTKDVRRGYKTLPGVPDEEELSIGQLIESHGLVHQEPWFKALSKLGDDVSYISRCLQRGEKLSGKPRIRLSTIHSAKGAEAHRIVLMLEESRKTNQTAERTPDDELRVWYVGVTRARERLSLVEGLDGDARWSCRWL